MLKIFFKTTLFVVLFFVPRIIFGAVVINEVLYDPEGVDTGKEYIRLYNNGDSAIDLTNWDLDPSSAAYFTFPSFVLGAKSFVTIHIGASGTNTLTDLYNNGSTNMSNTAGPVALFNSTTHSKTTLVDYIEYGAGNQTNESKAVDAGIWTAGAFIPDAPEGKAIKLKIDGQDNNSPDDWIEAEPTINVSDPESASQTTEQQGMTSAINNPPLPDAGSDIIAFIGQEINFDGTKSTDPENDELAYSWNMGDGKLIEKPNFNYKYLYPGTYLVTLMVYDGRNYATDTITVKIQSIQITINEFMPNPSGKDEEEWIEIFSNSNSITDISGWQLDDEDGGSKPFVFPQNTLIAPKSYLVFPRQITGIALNNDKGSVRLLMPENVVFQEINYEKPPQGKSSARTDEGFIWNTPTPGTTNLVVVADTKDKKIIYQGTVELETTKKSLRDSTIKYIAPEQEIEEGYKKITASETIEKDDGTESQLATARESISRDISSNLIYVFVIIVLFGLVIGLLLIRFRRHKNKLS